MNNQVLADELDRIAGVRWNDPSVNINFSPVIREAAKRIRGIAADGDGNGEAIPTYNLPANSRLIVQTSWKEQYTFVVPEDWNAVSNRVVVEAVSKESAYHQAAIEILKGCTFSDRNTEFPKAYKEIKSGLILIDVAPTSGT